MLAEIPAHAWLNASLAMTVDRTLDWTDLLALAEEVKAARGPGSGHWVADGSTTQGVNQRVMAALRENAGVIPGELGAIPIRLPGAGTLKVKDGYILLFIIAPAGEDLPALVDWMREEGKQEDLDEDVYREIIASMNMAFLTQMMSDPARAGQVMGALPHINEVIGKFFADKTAKESYEEGQRRRLLIGIVSKPNDLAENTQLRARNWYVTFPDTVAGKPVEFPGPPYRLSETPASVTRPPRLGEHTESVLGSL